MSDESVALQLRQIADAGARVRRVAGGYDSVPVFLSAAYTTYQVANTAGDLVLNVPAEADFIGRRLFVSAAKRAASRGQPSPVTEYTFRGIDWSNIGEETTPIGVMAETVCGAVELTEASGRKYQSAPLNAAVCFPQRRGIRQGVSRAYIMSAYAGGLRFPDGYWLRRGTALTVRFTPTYTSAALPGGLAGQVFEYRFTATFFGSKIVRVA